MNTKQILIGGRKRVNPSDVVAIVALENYSRVLFKDGKEFLSSTTLGIIASRFPKRNFVRTHRSYFINTHFIKEYDQTLYRYADMKNDLRVTISRRKIQNFKDSLQNCI
ncbi:MAG: LytR/AlgR family response regulator transcription factor [Leadbetterella sp.]